MPGTLVSYPVIDPLVQAQLASLAATSPPYTIYRIETTYDLDPGQIQAPLAPGPQTSFSASCEFINAHSPVMRQTVLWICSRAGKYPVLPDYATRDTNKVLLRSLISPVSTGYTEDATPVYFVSGRYEYGLLLPRFKEDGFPVQRTPFTNTIQAIGPINFDSTMLA